MGVFGWILYVISGIAFYFIIESMVKKFNIGKIDKIVFSNILVILLSGLCFRYSLRYTENIFLIFVFMMITDIIYNTYIIDRDFFDKGNDNIRYYISLIISGFIINQEFINNVNSIFLTGKEFRIIIWMLIIIYLYSFGKNRDFFKVKNVKSSKFMSVNNVLNSYSRFKYYYYDECDYDNKEISNILYAIMIYEDSKRNKVLRYYDNLKYKINGKKNKFGIMQVESKKMISDGESIELVYKKIIKIYDGMKKKDINKLFDKYYGYDNESVKYIFEIIKKF